MLLVGVRDLRKEHYRDDVTHKVVNIGLLPRILRRRKPFQHVVHPLSLGMILSYLEESLQQIGGDFREYNDISEMLGHLPDMSRQIVAAARQDWSPSLAVMPFNRLTCQVNEGVLAQLLATEIANSGSLAVLWVKFRPWNQGCPLVDSALSVLVHRNGKSVAPRVPLYAVGPWANIDTRLKQLVDKSKAAGYNHLR